MQVSFGEAIRLATVQVMEADSGAFVYGEGINDPGGFFGTTVGLIDQFGEDRCFDVPNSEECLTGFAVGASLLGAHPLFVNLRADFLLLAMNQIVNHAAKWPTMSGGQCNVPIVIRAIVGREWGQAAQHSGAYHALFAHVPGIDVLVPSTVKNAAGLLISAFQSERPSIMFESKLLYTLNDDLSLPIQPLPIGKGEIVREGTDLTMIAVSEQVHFAGQVADDLAKKGIQAEVLDLQCVQPIDSELIIESVAKTRRVAVFDIGWTGFGLSSEVARIVCESGAGPLRSRMISSGQERQHTPASCFREYEHYPLLDKVVTQLVESMG